MRPLSLIALSLILRGAACSSSSETWEVRNVASSSCTYHTLDESRHPPCFLQEDGLKAMINTGIRKFKALLDRKRQLFSTAATHRVKVSLDACSLQDRAQTPRGQYIGEVEVHRRPRMRLASGSPYHLQLTGSRLSTILQILGN